MMQVLTIEPDESIRDVLHLILNDEGYRTYEVIDTSLGLDMLRRTSARFVVLFAVNPYIATLDGRIAGNLLDAVAQDARLAQRHAYIMLTTSPDRVREALGSQVRRLGVRLIPMPFDIDELLGAVAAAAQQAGATAS